MPRERRRTTLLGPSARDAFAEQSRWLPAILSLDSGAERYAAFWGVETPKVTGLMPTGRASNSLTHGRGACGACPGSPELKVIGIE